MMGNIRDGQFTSDFDTSLFNEQTSNDPVYDKQPQFEISHNANIIEKLIHLSRFGNLLTLVVGSNGSGKSTILKNFLSSVDDNCQVCYIKAQPLLSIDQLFQNVIESFAGKSTFTGIPLTAKQYEEWAEQLPVISGNRLVVIDNAETLSGSVLQELCKLSEMQQSKETPHLNLILFGNYDLNITLEKASQDVLGDDGIYVIDIPPLSEEESLQWLEYLLRNAGIESIDDPDAVNEILDDGRGNLAQIEKAAKELIAYTEELEKFGEEPQRWKISVIGYWFAAMTIVVLLVLGLFFFQDEIRELTGTATVKREINDTQQSMSEEPIEALLIDESVNKGNDQAQITAEAIQPVEAAKYSEILQEPAADTSITDIAQSNEDQKETIDHKTVVAEDETEQLSTIDDAIKETVTESVEKRPGLKETSPIVEGGATDLKIATAYEFSADEQFLLLQPDTNYVVQLIGLRKEASVKSYLDEFQLTGIRYYRSAYHAKPWFIVVMGNFVSIEEASVARSTLPPELIKQGPWLKQVKVIKNEIQQGRELSLEGKQ